MQGVLTDVKKRSALPGLHVNFAKKEKIAHLSAVFTADCQREIMERKDDYAGHMLFLFVESFTDRSIRFGRNR